MGYQVLCRTFLYLMDGLNWIICYSMIMVDFFGYRPKQAKNRTLFFSLISGIYTIANLVLYFISLKTGKPPGVLNGFLVIFLVIYWMRELEEKKKFKLFLLSLVAIQMVVVFMEFGFVTIGTIVQWSYEVQEANLFLIILRPMLIILLVAGISRLSSRARSGPMSSFLIGVSFVVFVLLDGFMVFFGYENSDYFQPVMRLTLMFDNSDKVDWVVGVGILVTLFLLLIVFLLMIIKESESSYFRKKNAVSEYYLETQKEHYESLIRSNREIRKIKHDMKNHVYCIKELCEMKKYEELNEYIASLDDKLSQTEHVIYTGNEIADAIIAEKMQRANDLGIEFFVEGDLYGIEWSAIDTCTIFSNLLDNALEAVDRLESVKRKIVLQIRKNKNFLIITERNPIEKDIVIVDNTITSTKKDKASHGFGILNIKEAVAQYDGECRLLVEKQDEGREFVFEIMVPLGE